MYTVDSIATTSALLLYYYITYIILKSNYAGSFSFFLFFGDFGKRGLMREVKEVTV